LRKRKDEKIGKTYKFQEIRHEVKIGINLLIARGGFGELRSLWIGVLRTIGAAELLIGDAFASIGRQKIFGSLRCTNHSEGIPIHHEVMTDQSHRDVRSRQSRTDHSEGIPIRTHCALKSKVHTAPAGRNLHRTSVQTKNKFLAAAGDLFRISICSDRSASHDR